MSCDALASAAALWLAAASPQLLIRSPEPAALAPVVALEPLFADIVRRAGGLRTQVEALRRGDQPPPASFEQAINELAALDMQGHRLLAQRGADGDLKDMLKGVSRDLPAKLAAMRAAPDPRARDLALRDLDRLLNDNVALITAPPV